MSHSELLEKRKLTWFLLFAGFCCVFGFLGANFVLLTNFTNHRHFESLWRVATTILFAVICTSFYLVLGGGALGWGIRRYRRTVNRQDLISHALMGGLILSPVMTIGGMLVILMAPFVFGHLRQAVLGPKVVQSAFSPDGLSEAYVIDKPSIDGPNHHLYVKDAAGNTAFVTNLPEDVDYNKDIIWSPYSDIVVFSTHFKLIVCAPARRLKKEVTLGGERHYRKNGTFWVNYGDVLKWTDLEFPQQGTVSYRFEDEKDIRILKFAQEKNTGKMPVLR
jgi:hypothetical protein